MLKHWLRRAFLLLGLIPLLLGFQQPAFGQPARAREFKPGAIQRLEDLPRSRFRQQLEALPAAAREHALGQLKEFHFTEMDLDSLHTDQEGGIYYADAFTLEPIPTSQGEPVTAAAAVPVSPFPSNLIFHSRPGAPNVLFLNFSGENVSNTKWNTSINRTLIPAVAFSIDSDFTTFSDAEQTAIKRMWQRVAEDYAPYQVDVTTERPASFNTRTAEAVITRNTDADGQPNPSSDAGGVSYINVFGTSTYASYRPCWIYYNNLASEESYIAEATSHELGHNMGLSHDGLTDGTEYYGGHGGGATSWGPLMGTGYNRNVSQWSKGEYYLANNTQDDLALIAGKLGYRADDHGNTIATASGLVIDSMGHISSTTPESDPANADPANKGVIERNTDVDVFSFVTGTGAVDISATPWVVPGGMTYGGNLDVQLELYNQSGVLLLVSNPPDATSARIQTNLTEGVYYLMIRGSGAGSPMSTAPTGYTTYGSIGQYFISGSVVPSGLIIPPTASLAVKDVALPGVGPVQLAVTYTDNAGIDTSSIDAQDIRVLGPRGYDRLTRFVAVDSTVNGTPRVATYEADPPGGSTWTPTDNGVYTVWMQTNQVQDTEGAWVAGTQLGQFTVAVPLPIYSASMDNDPNWTLEPLWEYGVPNYSGTGPTSGFTGSKIIGYNLAGPYENKLTAKYATTPSINCAGASALTLQFQRWLRLRNGDVATIDISTNGGPWTSLWSTTRTVSDTQWQQVQYALPSWTAGTTALRIRWGISSGFSQNDIGWNIDDVEVLAGGSVDTVPPVAVLSVSDVTSGGSPAQSFTVQFTDATAVRISSLSSSNILVAGPNGYTNSVDFVGVDPTTDSAVCTASYSIPAPGGSWAAGDNGIYQLVLQDGTVTDIYNNRVTETVLGTFTVRIPTNTQALVVTPAVCTVPEGGTAQLTIHLAEKPALGSSVDVTVARSSGDSDLVVQQGSSLSFTADNWSVPVPVILGALPDVDQENGTAVFECRASGLPIVNVLVTEADTNSTLVKLTVSVNDPSRGTVVPNGGVFPSGSPIQFTAVPSAYFSFTDWAGGATGTNNPLVVVPSADITIEAVFSEVLTTNHGVPQWWLASYGYTNDFETAVDVIGTNGVPLWQSYIAGLDPNNPDSQLRLSIARTPDGTDSVLSWTTVPGCVYSLESTTNVAQGFSTVPSALDLPASIASITNTMAPNSTPVFYRLSVKKLGE